MSAGDPHPFALPIAALPEAQALSQWERELTTDPFGMIAYRGDDPVGPGERLFIAEAENGPAEAFQLYSSQVVSQDDVIPVVNPAVDLEDQPETVAGEIGEVPADRMLATETVSVDPGAAKPPP